MRQPSTPPSRWSDVMDRFSARPPQDGLDERALRLAVLGAIVGERSGELSLERFILPERGRILAQVVSKQKVVTPVRARPAEQVNVMHPRRASAKIIPSGNSRGAPMIVSELPKRRDIGSACAARGN